ncbi:hypothetical protein [Noviherbaspirillum aridicola]|uniref:Lipoprotein n=1 Tax=Noviherbaspirillum aridicola TaxID=2849687 RepID=A0ABQ4Q5A8_9BURK|nr:hypothetical protein [Noviherbaspirillum aridicola]GIZ52232.1 hypothetical protein NCCP691_22460 [Noviherbaspirillum aridicola]
MRKVSALALLPLFLAACGGGGGGGNDDAGGTGDTGGASNPAPSETVAASSAAVVAQLDAKPVSGTSATVQAYDLTADIGDTWRLLLNQDGTFTVKVLATQYGLTDITGTYSQTTQGSFVTFTGANNSFVVTLDKRTSTIVGTMTIQGKKSSVVGTGYAIPASLSKLAGDYVYFGSTRNAVGGADSGVIGGSFRIAENGTDVTLCDGGLINASGNCDSIDGVSANVRVSLTLAKDSTSDITRIKLGSENFGIVSLQAGDRGPVLVIDRFGTSGGVARTGALYAVKQQALKGNEADGTWECSYLGTKLFTVVANGNSMKATGTNGDSTSETFHYNKVVGTSANGFITSVAQGDSLTEGVVFLPLSSSLAVVELDGYGSDPFDAAAVCRPKN